MTVLSSAAIANSAVAAATLDEQQIFKKPLITGASISADWASLSPGKRLSLRYTDAKEIRTLAKSGNPSTEILKTVTRDAIKDRSVVIGFDLFFWDSALPSQTKSIEEMKRLIQTTKELNVPLVLGDIPELLPGRQQGRRELNQMIHRYCKVESNCFLVRLDDLHRQVMRDRALTVDGKRYSFKELVPDGLHIGDVAGNFLADYVLKAVKESSK